MNVRPSYTILLPGHLVQARDEASAPATRRKTETSTQWIVNVCPSRTTFVQTGG